MGVHCAIVRIVLPRLTLRFPLPAAEEGKMFAITCRYVVDNSQQTFSPLNKAEMQKVAAAPAGPR